MRIHSIVQWVRQCQEALVFSQLSCLGSSVGRASPTQVVLPKYFQDQILILNVYTLTSKDAGDRGDFCVGTCERGDVGATFVRRKDLLHSLV